MLPPPDKAPVSDEELLSLQLDRPGRGKSNLQLAKHTIDASLENKPIEKNLHILLKGDEIQKLSVVQSVPQLLQTNYNSTIVKLLPKIQQELPNASCEFHILTSKMYQTLLEKRIEVNLIQSILQGIEARDPLVSTTWLETLLFGIKYMNIQTIKDDVIPLAVTKSYLNKPLLYRVVSCKILGQVALHPQMSPIDVKKTLVPLVQSLCLDCLPEVRTTMCSNLPNIASGLQTDELIRTDLLPALVELSSDEKASVRCAAVEAVAEITKKLSSESIRTTIIPLIKKMCKKSNEEDDITFASIAKGFGSMISTIAPYLNSSDGVWFLHYYKSLTKRGTPGSNLNWMQQTEDPNLAVLCREYCAYNLPAVTLFTVTHVSTQLELWLSIFKELASDPFYMVRRTVGSCIHEIVRILGQQNRLIKQEILRLFKDDAEEVLEALIPNTGVTMEMLTATGVLTRESAMQPSVEMCRALLKTHMEIFKTFNWRLQKLYLAELEHLPNCVSSDLIHQYFNPLILNTAVEARALPVRIQACRTMLILLRYNTKEVHRRWLRENIISKLCNSKSCYVRNTFIKLCWQCLDIFSQKYFKNYFFNALLSLADDPVVNIRLSIVNFCPVLKQMLVLPGERNLDMSLESTMGKMEVTEKDKDVLDMLKCKLKEIRTSQGFRPESPEERRRIEEEEKVFQGKVLNISFNLQKQPQSEGQVKDNKVHQVTVKRAPEKARSTTSNLTSFLEQHFYIDAGVSLKEDDLKTEEVPTVSAENIEHLTETDLKQLSTSNITDDVKADLKKINFENLSIKDVEVKRRNKRYSSVLTADCLSKPEASVLRRRSLNIVTDGSRIPVSNAFRKSKDSGKVEVTEKPKEDDNKNNDVKENLPVLETKPKTLGARNSSLPVLVRRGRIEGKK